MGHLIKLWESRELLWYWTQREVSIRYKQSILGVAWAILQPAAMAAVFSFVFSLLLKVPTGEIPYPIFVFSALVPWTAFSNSMSQGIPSLVGQMNLVTKASFPREILPFGVIGATFVDFLSAFIIFLVMFLLYRSPLTGQVLWLPLLILLQFCLAAGVVLIGSALNVFFRDIRFIIPLLTQVWMYATPIMYPVDLVPERFRSIYAINPMVGIIESYRNIFLRGQPPEWPSLALSSVITILLFGFGYAFFKRVEPAFADVI